jgi:TRAP-type mannitol/chloroaromatic compound transport system substrate-binding protein
MRRFLSVSLLVCLVAVVLGGSFGCKSASVTYQWRMATSWNADHLFYTQGAQAICERVKTLSGGRLVIKPYPAGEIVDALGVMDAVSSGKVEMGHSWSGYWASRDPSFELFSSIPNQMVAQEWLVWLYGPSKGATQWQSLYANYHIVPFPGGLVGPEFGFFTKNPVRTLDDFKGLKLRVSGLASDVLKELGAITVLTAPGEIKAAMQSGEIDGFEFSTPAIDWPMGFQEVAPYISLPSWHQPSAMNETLVNQAAYAKLPPDLQRILEAACKEISAVDYFAGLEGSNAEYLSKYKQYGTQINVLDAESVQKLGEIANRLADEKAARNPFYAGVLASQRDFLTSYRKWEEWGDQHLYSTLSDADKTLSAVKKGLGYELSGLEKDLAATAQKLAGVDLTGSETHALLQQLQQSRPYLREVSALNRSAQITAVEPAAFRSYEGTDVGQQDQVVRLFRTQQPVMSPVFRTVEGYSAAIIEYPIFSSTGEIKGAVGALFQPETLLGAIIEPAVKGTDYAVWAMQTDGRILYDIDPQETGRNLYIDPIYQSFPQLITLGREISVDAEGSGQYQFLNTGLQKTVTKAARWITFDLFGVDWRLVLIRVIE